MILSTREVVDLAARCFSAAGFDPGTSRANATAIWWTEVYHGSGFETLHAMLDDLDEQIATTPDLDRRGSPISSLNGRGLPCLVSALPALDLSCAHAQRDGSGITYVGDAAVGVDGNVLGALAHRAAKRGYIGMVLSVDDAGTSRTTVATPSQSWPTLAETELPTPSAGYAAVERAIQTGRHSAAEAPLFRSSFDASEPGPFDTADARLLYRFLQQTTEPSSEASTDSGFVVACIDPSHPRYSASVGCVADRVMHTDDPFDRRFEPELIRERLSRFIEEGVDVERERWRDVFEFSNGVLAPPFEGSEKGAGFDLNELE